QEILATARAILDAIEHPVRWRAAAAADRVVAAELVLDDREDRSGDIGIELVAGCEKDRTRRLHRVGRMVALLRVGRVVAEEIHRLLTFEVGDAQDLALAEDARPGRAGGDDRIHRIWNTS